MNADAEPKSRRRGGFSADLAAVAILALLTLAFFSRVIVRRQVFFHSDIKDYFVPMKTLYAERLSHWNLPFWNPYIECGYPDQAEGQNGPLYPPHLLAFSTLPVDTALTVLLILHVFLCGLFMYVFARTLRLSRPASVLTGFFYMFTGFLLSHFNHPTILFPAAWAPLLLAAVELALRRGSWLIGAWGGAVVGMQALVGYPPMVVYSLFAAAIYFAARARQASRAFGWRTVLAAGALLAAFGAGLWAVQAVPTLQWASYTQRAYSSAREYMLTGSLSLRHLALFVFPNYLGQAAFGTNAAETWIWEYTAYAGLLTLVLAGVALTAWRRSWPFAAMAVLGVFMALATLNPLYYILPYVPGLNGMRVPARYLYLTSIGLCVMAGLGSDILLKKCPRNARALWALVPCILCAAYTVLVVVPARKTGPTPAIWPQEAAWAAMTLGAAALIVWLACARRIGAAALVACVGVISAADLWSFDYFLTPSIGADFYRDPPRVVKFLMRDKGWFRIASWRTDRFLNPTLAAAHGWWGNRKYTYLEREALVPNFAEIYRLREMRGYSAFVPLNEEALAGVSLSKLAHAGNDPTLVGLMGVKYIVTAERLYNPHLQLVYDSYVRVYRNDLVMPRCFFVTSAVVAPDMASQLGLLVSDYFSPRRFVVLAKPPAIQAPPSGEPAHAQIRWTEPRPERLVVRVRCDRPGILVVADTYDAPWRVFVDGKEDEILIANYALRAVALPAGTHEIEFRYDTVFFLIGAAISLLTAALLIGLTVRAWRWGGGGKSGETNAAPRLPDQG